MSVRILQTRWETQRDHLQSIRQQVFVDEQGVPPELELDENDASALHLLALTETGKPVGTARMLADGHIGRMAVLRAFRGQGIGGQMLRLLVELAAQKNLPAPFLHAQCRAIGFYERLGFVAEGPVFLDAGIEHRLMKPTQFGATG